MIIGDIKVALRQYLTALIASPKLQYQGLQPPLRVSEQAASLRLTPPPQIKRLVDVDWVKQSLCFFFFFFSKAHM